MKNPFTSHPASRGETYLEHGKFAMKVALRLGTSTVFFFIHAIIPAVSIPVRFNLSAMSDFLKERNDFRENPKETASSPSSSTRKKK